MSDTLETVEEVIGIVGSVISGLGGNLPAIISVLNLMIEMYDKILNSPGEFSLDDFQRRIDALPDYEV